MSLQLQAVDRLFERLSATYGRQFINLYEGLDAQAIKALWGHELAGFSHRLQDIAWALENLPENAPNAIQFRNHCRRAPQPEPLRLPEPPADPARVKAELAKLGAIVKGAAQSDGRAWARAIMTRHLGGLRVNPTTLRFAKEALAPKSRIEG